MHSMWMAGWLNNEWVVGHVDGVMGSMWVVMSLDGRIDGCMDGWLDEWMDGWMVRWVDG